MQPNTDKEFRDLPHVILTGGNEWDPKVLDHSLTDKPDWCDTIKDLDAKVLKTPFDAYGNYLQRTPDSDVVLPPKPPAANAAPPDPLTAHSAESNISDSHGFCEVFFAASFQSQLQLLL